VLLFADVHIAGVFLYDARWRSGERLRDGPSLMSSAPLYSGLATLAQGGAVAVRLDHTSLKPGGFITTNINSGP
jgi:hypothetical protein